MSQYRETKSTSNTTGESLDKYGTKTNEEASNLPVDVQSIITQVDRNATSVTIPSQTQREVANESVSRKNTRRSFLSSILCCGSSTDTVPQTIQMASVPPTSTSQRKQNNNISHSTTTSSKRSLLSVQQGSNRNPPARMPDMPILDSNNKKKCLALDLDETLVHSSFQPVEKASFIISVVIEGVDHSVYVMKRPGVDEFIRRMANCYELVIYTASLSKYADPLLDLLDKEKVISKRLFRENCVFYDGHYVKDLSLLKRDISQTIIVDNSPMSYIFHPENAIDCVSFFDDPDDVELWQIADFLESIESSDDVRLFCRNWREWCSNNPSSVPVYSRNSL